MSKPPVPWLYPETVEREDRSGYVTNQRRKDLILEFINQFTKEEWVAGIDPFLHKVRYLSTCIAVPSDRDTWWPEAYKYEVTARFDYDEERDVCAIVIVLEHFYRSKFYGLGLREIWLPLETLSTFMAQSGLDISATLPQYEKMAKATYGKYQAHRNEIWKPGLNVGKGL